MSAKANNSTLTKFLLSFLEPAALRGIANADDAWERIRAGASLVQLYSAMVYEGPNIARRIAEGLAEKLREAGFSSIAEAMGTE